MNTFRMWWLDVRGKVIVTLLVLWLATLIHQFQWQYVWFPFAAIVLTVGFDLVLTYIFNKVWVVTLSPWVTGLLIGLIADPSGGLVPLAVACWLAVVGKQFIGTNKHSHVFNPAAFGLVAAAILFDRPVAWWAAAWGFIPVIIVAIGMFAALKRLRRLWMPISFLAAYLVTNTVFTSFASALPLTIDGTVFLFSFVMLPEPVTAVSGNIWRYAWGIFVGALMFILNVLKISLGDPLLLPLLLANTLAFLFVRKPWTRQTG